MKREKWLSFAWGFCLSFLLSACGIGCLVTAFGLMPVSMWSVCLWCLGCSGAFSGAFILEKPWLCRCLPFAAVGILWLFDGITGSLGALLEQVALVWGAEETVVPLTDLTSGLCVISTGCAWVSAWCVCRRKHPGWSGFAAIPLLVCLPVREAAPEGLWLFGFLGAMGLLILTQGLRRKLPEQGKRLVVMALLPGLLMSAVLYFALPRDDYHMDKISSSLILNMKNWFTGNGPQEDPGGPVKVGGGAVGLSQLGDRRESGRKVMEVTWDRGGALYLRSCAYDTYYNNTWTNLAVPNSLNWPDASVLEPAGTLQIQTNGYLDMVLTPYYPMDGELDEVTRGISNYVGKQEYTYSIGRLPGDYERLQGELSPDINAYTQLPAQSAIWARKCLEDVIGDSQSVSQKAKAIGTFVSNCAEYTLKPGKMSSQATDFVRWFVEDNGKGYCVHFASAATVFLRAAGIPARYVTGYLFTAKEGQATEVYGKNAHAWTEYWLPGVGWVVLEATPAAAVEAQLTVEEPPAETAPEEEPVQPGFRLVLPGPWLWWTLLAVVILATLVQWRLRVWLRRRKCRRGGINEQAVAWWEELERLCACLGRKPHEAALALAQKAQFSQHLLTDAELEAIRNAALQTRKVLKDLPLYKRLYHRLILALY